jgi:DNA invertase Pin-like site-specific DNA recombinase
VDEGRRKALEEDKVMFRPPFGYKIVEGKLVVDEEKRTLLRKILEDINQGKNINEVAGKNGVTKDFVRRVRSNPIYRTGEVRYAGEVVFKVEPILPKGGR